MLSKGASKPTQTKSPRTVWWTNVTNTNKQFPDWSTHSLCFSPAAVTMAPPVQRTTVAGATLKSLPLLSKCHCTAWTFPPSSSVKTFIFFHAFLKFRIKTGWWKRSYCQCAQSLQTAPTSPHPLLTRWALFFSPCLLLCFTLNQKKPNQIKSNQSKLITEIDRLSNSTKCGAGKVTCGRGSWHLIHPKDLLLVAHHDERRAGRV